MRLKGGITYKSDWLYLFINYKLQFANKAQLYD